MRTEDEVRDSAKIILGFDNTEPDIQQGTGQITTFNRLGFKGVNDKPDGWYFPNNKSEIAIILETKSEAEDLQLSKWVDELSKMCLSLKRNIDVLLAFCIMEKIYVYLKLPLKFHLQKLKMLRQHYNTNLIIYLFSQRIKLISKKYIH